MRRTSWVILLAFAVCGCSRPGVRVVSTSAGTSAPAPEPSPVQVITDPGELQNARELAAGRKEADQIDDDSALLLFADSPEGFQRLQQERGRIIPLLKKRLARREPSGIWQRTEAAFTLLRLNDPQGTAAARELMKDPKAAGPVLSQLSNLPPTDLAKLAGAQTLVLGHLQSTDGAVRRNAIFAAGAFGSPDVNGKLLELIRSGKDPEGQAAAALARSAPSRELLDLCQDGLRKAGSHDRYQWLMAIAEIAKAKPAALRSAAVEVCASALGEASQNIGIDGAQMAALEALEKHPGERGASLLSGLVRKPQASLTVRRSALEAVARRDHEEGRALALASLPDRDLTEVAVRTLGEVGRGSGDEKLVKVLTETAGQNTGDTELVGAVARSLLTVGGEAARKAATSLVDRVPTADRITIRWAEKGITPQKALDRLVALGVLDAGAAAKARKALSTQGKAEEGNEGELGADSFAHTVFEAVGLLTSFDAETDELPVRHDRLLKDFAKKSGGVFRPEATFERWEQKSEDDEEAPYTVQFIHRGRLYRFTAQNLGDWYDVAAVAAAMNQALADAGEKRRFVPLESGDQVAAFVCVDPKALAAAARELDLPISGDPDAARQSGKAFEEKVIQELKKGR